uniref:Uncharacterized protein n=1 Tax=Oryza rufipogon TaxID=4529 RepID=A0A0E0QMG7_ORYRU
MYPHAHVQRRRRPQVISIFIGVHEEKRSLDGCLPPFIGNPRDETREGCGQSNSRARSLDGRQGIKGSTHEAHLAENKCRATDRSYRFALAEKMGLLKGTPKGPMAALAGENASHSKV